MKELRKSVCAANRDLERLGLVTLTWGNVSGYDPERKLIVIKPSGVPYASLTPEQMVIVDLDGKVVEGELRPSSDTPTHATLYRNFSGLRGIVHTHSPKATAFCQAARALPCFGTTHADHFHGTVPLARALTPQEVEEDYEGHTGNVIVERFRGLDPLAMPAVLVAHHAPFTWGPSPRKALENAVALEAVAAMALDALRLDPALGPMPAHISEKHYQRKHGPGATYGQAREPQAS
ncbi:MAG: L-ribulose-5-phosphate 4-epimerase AraD [Verrucomicrobia bacterium]|nr:L-ribulose-5-phosphate 4-epimerase AraD [Verrucomicrobiota bacterium]